MQTTSFTIVCLLAFLLSQSEFTDGACKFSANGTHGQCDSLDDVEKLENPEIVKALKVTHSSRYVVQSFRRLVNLKSLDLSGARIARLSTNSFTGIKNLENLDLSNNKRLYTLDVGVLEGLKKLQHLNLSNDAFAEIPLGLSSLPSLEFVDLAGNNLICNCWTLEFRDKLISRGVDISNGTLCGGPENLKDLPLTKPEAEAVCLLDKQDVMQMDQPAAEGSGEGSGDPFDDIGLEDIPEDEENVTKTLISTDVDIPLTSPEPTTSHDESEIFFYEDPEQRSVTPPTTKVETTTTVLTTAPVPAKSESKHVMIESSGDDLDDLDGSGLEGSGTGIVPPISWDTDYNHSDHEEDSGTYQTGSTSTTESAGILDSFLGIFWGTTALPPKETSTPRDMDLEEENFIPASPEVGQYEKETEAPIIPLINKIDTEKIPEKTHSSESGHTKLDKVQVVEASESPDAEATQQPKKGMGSYVVLAVLLAVLVALIGLAAYKGDFCKGGRKRSNRHSNGEIENGTELKDLKKSLLDISSSQPKITSNGGKPETLPLVTPTGVPTDVKNDDEPTAKFVGTINEAVADPVKPPRRSFSPNDVENDKKNETNGNVHTMPEASFDECSRLPATVILNGKHDRDSLSSLGASPSSGSARLSNARLSPSLSPGSPSAHRVKITLQDNPDSVPKTPLLITRTKAGENLVKTP